MSLNERSRLQGTLWASHSENPKAPSRTGVFEILGHTEKVHVAAWDRNSADGAAKCLSFQVELSRDLKYFGIMKLNPERKTDNDPHYCGVLNLTREMDGPTLNVRGYDRGFLSIVIEPCS
ncbi:hypothetical protein [Ottowia sp.]|uniref:hypothetical protein n=1 Tax=Ottowia sp. TaxID=1898956 RepID=UPI0025D90CBC|nr:hypothetical protein [Ottowia sp.]MBK6616316.1 hypothetical protein [Ottowia sp.]